MAIFSLKDSCTIQETRNELTIMKTTDGMMARMAITLPSLSGCTSVISAAITMKPSIRYQLRWLLLVRLKSTRSRKRSSRTKKNVASSRLNTFALTRVVQDNGRPE